MAYGVDAGGRDAEGTALVVDVGGSACDASVVACVDGVLEVAARAGKG